LRRIGFVSPNAPRTLVLILRDGASRLLRMGLPKHRRERRAGWSDPCIFLFFSDSGPFQSVAIPDQRCTASRCIACGHAIATAGFLIMDSLVKQPSSFPRPHFCVRALPLCFTHPPSRGGRSAERRSGVCETPVGVHVTRHARRLARRLASHDAGRSPLGAPPWRF
jgi:hypothetical protein